MDLVIVRLVLVLVGLLPTGVVLLKTRGTRRLVAAGIRTKGVVVQVIGIRSLSTSMRRVGAWN